MSDHSLTTEEAISAIKSNYPPENYELLRESLDMAIEALKEKEQRDNTEQWLDDMGNPLEPLKLQAALQSEIMKLNYRKKHKPKSISVLDYTIIAALAKELGIK